MPQPVKPKMDALRARQTVAALGEAKPDAFRGEAVLALLAYYFTAVDPDETEGLVQDPQAYGAVARALAAVPRLDPPLRERYFFNVVIPAMRDPDVRQLASPLLDAYDDRALEALLTRALADDDPLHQRNLLAAVDYMRWSSPGRLNSDVLREKLKALANALKTSKDPTIAGVARGFLSADAAQA